MKKTAFLLAFIIGVFFFGQNTKADFSWYQDNFDSYGLGTINGTSSWVSNVSYLKSPIVINTNYSSSPNGLELATDSITFYPISTSTNYWFKFKIWASTTANALEQIVWASTTVDTYTSLIDMPEIKKLSGVCSWGGIEWVCSKGWVELEATIEVDLTTENLNISLVVDGQTGGDATTNWEGGITRTWPTFLALRQGSGYTTHHLIDDFEIISGSYIENTGGNPFGFFYDETAFSTQNPIGCQYNKVASSSGNIIVSTIFQFTNWASSGVSYNNIYVNFWDSDGNSTSTTFTTSTWAPGSAYSGSKNITLPAKTYRIEFVAEGYDLITGEAKKLVQGGTNSVGNICECTSVGYKAIGDVDFNNTCTWGTTGFLSCQTWYDDCIDTATTTIDTIVCKMAGLGLSLICPSQTTLAKSMGIINSLKTRFPYNYILATKNAVQGYGSSSATSGSSYYINDSGWTASIKDVLTFGSLNVITVIRNTLSAVFVLLFGFWIINHVARDFFT